MRWNPIHTVETIVISVVSMLSDPTDESPANIDAAVSSILFERHLITVTALHFEHRKLTFALDFQKEFRDDFPTFKKKVARCVARSQEGD